MGFQKRVEVYRCQGREEKVGNRMVIHIRMNAFEFTDTNTDTACAMLIFD